MTARIAMVLNSPGLGGVTEVGRQLLLHLPRDRFAAHAFFLKTGDDGDTLRQERLESFFNLGVTIGVASGVGGKVGAIAEMTQWLHENRIGLVHTHSYRPNLYGRMAGALLRPSGLKIIAHYHNHYDDKWRADAAALPLERRLVDCTDVMIAVSRQVRKHVAQSIGVACDRIAVIENAVDRSRFAAVCRDEARRAFGLDANDFMVGLVGRVCEQKGQEDLVAAAVMLDHQGVRPRIMMFGDVEDTSLHTRLCRQIDAAGLSGSVVFAGHVTNVPQALAAADIVALPSRWEGYPLVVTEALAAGRPIVASAVGAVPDMVRDGETGLLIPPRDPGRLAAAIADLSRDAGRRRQLGSQAASSSRDYTWAHAAEAVARLYDAVLASGRGP